MLIIPLLVLTQPDSLTLERGGGNVWVVLDDLPAEIAPAAIYRLFALLGDHVQHTEDSLASNLHSDIPMVIRFVPADAASQPFPAGTEGFAGLVGLANWRCIPDGAAQQRRRCGLWREDTAPDDAPTVVLAVIRVQADPGMTAGYLAHELSHALGAVDGPRCPASEDYNPLAQRVPDCQDAYWWYGVTGFFDLKPSGIVWEAINGRCAQSERPTLCVQLSDILADLEA